MPALFRSQLLPPDPRRFPQPCLIPGVPYWPHAEDPRTFPWHPTHRIHFTGPNGIPGTVDVMFIADTDVPLTWDGAPRKSRWYGFEREQWQEGGTTGWAFLQDHPYPNHPHTLYRTDAWLGDHWSLAMEKLAG